MPVSAIEFVTKYVDWLEVIDHVVKPEYYPAMRKMYCIDPHDLVRPDTFFTSESHAIGLIWCLMMKTHKQIVRENQNARV
jgi:hypothetical protein